MQGQNTFGAPSQIEIDLTQVEEPISFVLENFTPVAIGQQRLVRDNSYLYDRRPIFLRSDQSILEADREDNGLYDFDLLEILNGPRESLLGYTNQVEKLWFVQPLSFPADPGWIPERWLGEEFPPSRR